MAQLTFPANTSFTSALMTIKNGKVINVAASSRDYFTFFRNAHANSAAQGEGTVHLLVGELEIEDVEVLPQVLLAGRLGNGTDFVLL